MLGAGVIAVLLDQIAFKPLRALTRGGLVVWIGFPLVLLGLVGDWEPPTSLAVSLLGALLLLLGVIVDYRAIAPIREQQVPTLAPMISSIGASIVLISLAQGLFSSQVSRFPPDIFPNQPIALGTAAVIAPIQAFVLILSLFMIVGVKLVIGRTQTGRAIRAIAYNPRTARLLGVNVDLVIAQTFFVSGALAGAAGALLGLAFNRLEPTMGNEVELAGLTVIIVGGMGSVGGAAIAAFLVGMMRVLSVAYLDSSLRDAFVFALLILILLWRPSGLFGRRHDLGR
jgi:branched-chain amino acid transport system permease protein